MALRSVLLAAGISAVASWSATAPATVHRAASCSSPLLSMKVFDWKVRGDAPPTLETINLGNLKASPGSNQRGKRKGRGVSAGQGVTCGFGNDGQKARAGRSVRPGFEGGQIPLYRRLPKFVGRPMGSAHSYTKYGLIKTDMLNKAAEGATIDYASLMELGAASKSKFSLKKVVGGAEPLTVKGLTVKAHAFTTTARQAIEANGGSCVVLSPTTNQPLGEGEAAPAEEA